MARFRWVPVLAIAAALALPVATAGASPPTGQITGYRGLCLAGPDSGQGNVAVAACATGHPGQTWTITGAGTVEAGSGLCLNIARQGTANGTKIITWTCGSWWNEQFVPQPNGELLNPHTGKCLDDSGFGAAGTL